MKNSPGKGKIIFIMVLVLLVFLVVFYFVANGERKDELTKLSSTEATIQRDLDINYPQTPKAVVRYYAELSQCMYDPTNSDKEVEMIAKQSRLLFDDELKARQSDADYLSSLKNTIAAFLNDNRKIVSFTVSPSSEVVYDTLDIGEVATLYCTYTMQKGSVSYSDPEHFLLRKDGDGRWKILGWQSASLDDARVPKDTGTKDAEEEDEGETPGAEAGNNTGAGAEPAETPTVDIKTHTVEIPSVEVKIPGNGQ
ncbi:MAG: hypothetical protein K6A90_15885 [Lachnospiraceae bacterium]|nr:hypothetical protein [Lachnospiraceae bacterium]